MWHAFLTNRPFLVSVNTPDFIYLEYAASSPLCLPPLSHRKDTEKNRGLLHLNNTKLKGTHHVFSRLSCWCDENMDTKIIHVSWVDPWLQCFMPVGSLPTQTHTQTTLLRDSRLHVIFPTQPRLYMKQTIDTQAPEND